MIPLLREEKAWMREDVQIKSASAVGAKSL
jgi:hypothetical protein